MSGCRGLAVKTELEAATASISRQKDIERQERDATKDLIGTLGAQARETETRVMMEHEAAMARMLSQQQALVGSF